jgi:hypothetical protein
VVKIMSFGIKVLRKAFSSWYGRVGALIVVSAAGGLGFWFSEQVTESYTAAQDRVMTTLSLGLAPVLLWVAVFAFALSARRSWFRRANLWFASLILLAFTLGGMAFFEAPRGTFAWATLNGDVTLGGKVGEAVAGPLGLAAGLRVAALLTVGAAIAAPGAAVFLVGGAGRLLAQTYVYLVLAAKTITMRLRQMYSVKPESRFAEGQSTRRLEESRKLKKALAPPPGAGGVPDFLRLDEDYPPDAPGSEPPDDHAAPMREDPASGEADMPPVRTTSLAQTGDERTGGKLAVQDEGTNAGRFNKFWGKTVEPASSKLAAVQHYRNTDADDSPADSPVVRNLAASWERPPDDLLIDAPSGGISDDEMADTAETIRRTLAEYNVEVEIGQIKPGPTVTMYGLVPGWIRRYKQVKVSDDKGNPKLDASGKPVSTRAETKTRVKVDSIMSREKDLALALKTHSLRIETPVLGESLVGIEVPNPKSSLVTLRNVVESEEFERLRSKASLPIGLGRGTGGEAVVVDLAKMPHLLVAGATGSGKSVCINTIITCLIMEKSPAEMRLLLVDPKRVEMTAYNGIPHLMTPVVVETDEVVALLKGLIQEMLNRYRRMEEVSVRNIEAYNRKMPDLMPYLVVAVDELADLMMSASFDVEQSLCRLAQLGRATGIHLIVATQRPSVDVVTGLIKANFPSRISFGVTSQIDSRTILDSVGAEKLLGRGDMLYQGVEASRPERVQGVFISDDEIDDIVTFWKNTPPGPLPEIPLHTVGDGDSADAGAAGGDMDSRDALLDKAIELAHSNKKISSSLLQRRMRIGYPRAARLMDQLEEEGIVGPSDGSKSRDVIIGTM